MLVLGANWLSSVSSESFRLANQRLMEGQSQVEELQKNLQEQGLKADDVSLHNDYPPPPPSPFLSRMHSIDCLRRNGWIVSSIYYVPIGFLF